VNSRATSVLLEVLKNASVQLEMFVTRDRFHTFVRQQGKSEPPKLLCIDIQLLGCRQESENIGALLSEHGMYLQDPIHPNAGVAYCNPHLMVLDVSEEKIWFRELEMGSSQGKDVSQCTPLLNDLSHQHELDASAAEFDNEVITTSILP
jgi:hypothetical protein